MVENRSRFTNQPHHGVHIPAHFSLDWASTSPLYHSATFVSSAYRRHNQVYVNVKQQPCQCSCLAFVVEQVFGASENSLFFFSYRKSDIHFVIYSLACLHSNHTAEQATRHRCIPPRTYTVLMTL